MNQNTLRHISYIGDAGTPAGSPIEQNDREETSDTSCDGASNDGFGLNYEERPLLDNLAMKHHGHSLRIGTWNVRTLYRAGSLDNCIREMEINRLDIYLVFQRLDGRKQVVRTKMITPYSSQVVEPRFICKWS